ncbi:MAG: DEAD/DEAH box helicase, partial [Kiritimatiellia bacterium]
EATKLENWADDVKLGMEREIKNLDRQIRETRRAATVALTLEEKLAGQKQIKALESQRSEKRRSLFEAQDQVDHQRAKFIAVIEGKLKQQTDISTVFTLQWRVE